MKAIKGIITLWELFILFIGLIPQLFFYFIYENVILSILFLLINIFFIFKFNGKKIIGFMYLICTYLSYYMQSLNPGTDDTFATLDKVISTTFWGSFFALLSIILFIIFLITIFSKKNKTLSKNSV